MSSNYSPYRYGYNNPIRFIDVLGLFETKYQAKEYSDNMRINGRIQKNDDGTYSINDYNNHISYTAGDDSGNMLGNTHVHDGVIESLLVTNEKSPSYFLRVKDFSDNGFNLFSEYYYNKIPTSTKSKYVYETSKFLKQKTGIKIKGYSNIYRNVIPKTFRVIGNTSSVISFGKVGCDVVNARQVKGSNILDATIGTISLIPRWGWIADGVYFGSDVMVTLFTGNSIGEHLDYYIEDNFDKNNGTLLKW